MAPEDFVPEQVSLSMRGRRRFGADGAAGDTSTGDKSIGSNQPLASSGASSRPNSAISSSVVFHEDGPLFDELDDLFPHSHEGGKLATDPTNVNSSLTSGGTSYSRSNSNDNSSLRVCADSSLSASRSLASSVVKSLQSSGVLSGDKVPDYESMIASSDEGALAQLMAGIEERYKGSAALSQASKQPMGKEGNNGAHLAHEPPSKRESIVGGRRIAEMTAEEQWELLAPDRSDRSGDAPIAASVDWSSLSKSCKRAKNAFRDADSGQLVVKNMFLTHLRALSAVLTLYAKRHCNPCPEDEGSETLEEVKAQVTETKRAMRFAMACLAPPRVEEDSPASENGAEAQDTTERYRATRKWRQELQEIAVKGLAAVPSTSDGETRQPTGPSNHCGLHIPLVKIVYADRPFEPSESAERAEESEEERHAAVSAIERGKLAVRVLAARLLCNLVTDNPSSAETILRDVPLSPSLEHIERRMAATVLEPQQTGDGDDMLFWSDLIAATAKVKSGGAGASDSDASADREILAAVAAALHNMVTSLEARESLMEFDDAMKRRQGAKKHHQASRQDSPRVELGGISEIEVLPEEKSADVGFEVASDRLLLATLLRNILPSDAALKQTQAEKEHIDVTRPKFKPPATAVQDLSDSATEWISLVLERLASRGLLPRMLRSAGGAKSETVTPEQVVLVSCLRQAVDDYHSAMTPSGESGSYGRRQLSIDAKQTGMAVAIRPHPLWGRAEMSTVGRAVQGRHSRTAIPVLLSLANAVERLRVRSDDLLEGRSEEAYEGEQKCTIRLIDDLCDILAQSLGMHATSSSSGGDNVNNKQCFIADARSVLGRESTLLSSCCKDLARVLDEALARNSGRKAREMRLSAQEQQTAIVNVRLVGNLVYQCRQNQDLLRITPVPLPEIAGVTPAPNTNTNAAGVSVPTERTGLHVILSTTSLAPACFTLREWCIVAIRNAVENNAANTETVRRLEANQVVDDTPELRRAGVKVEMDGRGTVRVQKRDPV
ncbi:hypothetical protein ACHAXT_007744 [Thalassiosira profunda]